MHTNLYSGSIIYQGHWEERDLFGEVHNAAVCDQSSQCSLALIIVIYALFFKSMCDVKSLWHIDEWHILCAPSDLISLWRTDIQVPTLSFPAAAHTI